MVVLPAISALIAFGCVVAITRDAIRHPKPDRIAWIVAFTMFALAASAEVVGELAGWTAPLARLYYLAGAILVVAFLAIGQLYLLAPKRIGKFAPGVAMLLTAVAASTVLGARVEQSRLADDGWDALTRTTGLKILAIGVNSVGTLILIGGLIYSAVRFRQLGTMRNRMVGCLLIAGGTLTVATGGTLTRLGSRQYLYIAMSIGITLIFSGYLWTKRSDVHEIGRPTTVSRARFGFSGPEYSVSPAITHIESLIARMNPLELSEECRIWSVPGRDIDAFTRSEARRVWSFRNRLTDSSQSHFDAFPLGLRLQLSELYFEVLTATITPVERSGTSPSERGSLRDQITTIPTSRASTGSVDLTH